MISSENILKKTNLLSVLSANGKGIENMKEILPGKQKKENGYISTEQVKKLIKSRSKKIKMENQQEISFEKQMLTAHKSKFQHILKTYISECSKILQLPKINFRVEKLQSSQLEDSFDSEELSKALESCNLLDKREQLQFLEDLKYEENLASIILWIHRTLTAQIWNDIIFLVCFIWEQYLLGTKKTCKVKDLIQKIKTDVSENIYAFGELMKNLTLKKKIKESQRFSACFSSFIFNLIQIIVLVIEGYFESSIHCLRDDIIIGQGQSTSSKISSRGSIKSKSSTEDEQKSKKTTK